MSLPLRTDLTVYCGGLWDDEWTWRDEDGALVNLTGWTARMDIRAQTDVSPAAPGTPILQLTSAGGTIVLGGTAGTITLNVPAATTATLAPTVGGAEYVYDLELVSGAVTGSSTVTGAIAARADIGSGSVAGTTTVNGALAARGALNSGSVTGSTTATGALAARVALGTGSVAGTTTVAGAIAARAALGVGAVAGSSSIDGLLSSVLPSAPVPRGTVARATGSTVELVQAGSVTRAPGRGDVERA